MSAQQLAGRGTWVVALALAIPAVPAQAVLEFSPYVSAGMSYDDNVRRENDEDRRLGGDSKQSDTASTYTVGASSNYSFGQQSLFASGFANKTEYRRLKEVSYEGYGFDGGLNWRLTPTLDGSFSGGSGRSLQDFASRPGSDGRSLVDTDKISTSVNLRVFGDYRVSASGGQARVRHSELNSRSGDSDQDSASLSLTYLGRTHGSIGVEGSVASTDYIRRGPGDGQIEEAEQVTVQLVGTWQPSPITSLNYALGSTRRDNRGQNVEDNSGIVGNLGLTRTFSEKTSAFVGATRSISSPEDQGEGAVVSTGFNAGASWKATRTIGTSLNYFRQNDDFDRSPLTAGRDRQDKLQGVSGSVSYGPREWLSFSAGAGWQERKSNLPGGDFDSFTASIEIKLLYP